LCSSATPSPCSPSPGPGIRGCSPPSASGPRTKPRTPWSAAQRTGPWGATPDGLFGVRMVLASLLQIGYAAREQAHPPTRRRFMRIASILAAGLATSLGAGASMAQEQMFFGDADGFGFGAPEVDGDLYRSLGGAFFGDYREPADPPTTD